METIEVESEILIPLFVLPADVWGLVLCSVSFLSITVVVYFFERFWTKRASCVYGENGRVQRILLWEFGTVVSLIFAHLLGFYCVVLPLLFLLAFLSMWYLIRAVAWQ
ncbi:MAG: hypothetical protein KAR24_02915 [Candidatus Pacebacteria bacterium]|nr:hypothetical protein [Candidatus Paceibacterota bacterium]